MKGRALVAATCMVFVRASVLAGDPIPQGTTFSVFTGVMGAPPSPPEGRFLIEPVAPPVHDDVVLFDELPDEINEYTSEAGGIRRFVNETLEPISAEQWRLTVTITGVSPSGGPGDLWPRGFQNDDGVPMTFGAVGLGVEMPAALGGQDTLDWPDTYIVEELKYRVRSNGNFTFFVDVLGFIDPEAWNGRIGVAQVGAADNDSIDDAIEFSIVFSGVPEPSSLSLLSIGLIPILRRRSRAG